ncbi:hypothetical protein GCM10010129_79850 [Streptomyces fumigatiscleroticus]|nr:hypothetical protein GCM10010129_79850 [Streptomyces fumigatiscleroticus]
MPFGSGNRHPLSRTEQQPTQQLTQITSDLAALKQHVADQQHAIDQAQLDANTAVREGLAEIRDVVRVGLDRATELLTGPLAKIGNELVALRDTISRLDGQIKAAAAPPQPRIPESDPAAQDAAPGPASAPKPVAPAPDSGSDDAGRQDAAAPTSAPDPEPAAEERPADSDGDDLATLRAAAGISAAVLHAHRDTWEFLVKHAGTDQHFHLPGAVTEAAGTVIVYLSGPSLVAILTSLNHVKQDTSASIGTQAIAHHLHERIGNIVKKIASDPQTGISSDPVTIRIDDRPKTEDDSAQDEADGGGEEDSENDDKQ